MFPVPIVEVEGKIRCTKGTYISTTKWLFHNYKWQKHAEQKAHTYITNDLAQDWADTITLQ